MHVLISIKQKIPAPLYGGSERVVWDLGKELCRRGHKVTFLAGPGSHCDFADMLHRSDGIPLAEQIPAGVDVVHFNDAVSEAVPLPQLVTVHGNANDPALEYHENSVFVSAAHAAKYGSGSYVHNGLDWEARFPRPDPASKRGYFHFLGKAAWRKKNVRGAIRTARKAGATLRVLGGTRLNFKMGFRFTPYPSIRFEGMVDDSGKAGLLSASRGLLFPVLWDEPFGLALTESLYFGCPVFGTPYGSLPEIVTEEFGLLSASSDTLAEAMKNAGSYDRARCHEYARDCFGVAPMTDRYLALYGKVINGESLNPARPRLQAGREERRLPFR